MNGLALTEDRFPGGTFSCLDTTQRIRMAARWGDGPVFTTIRSVSGKMDRPPAVSNRRSFASRPNVEHGDRRCVETAVAWKSELKRTVVRSRSSSVDRTFEAPEKRFRAIWARGEGCVRPYESGASPEDS
jgi:hypothetical protein